MNASFTNSDILTILKGARLFTQFSDDQLNQLISFSSIERFAPQEIIIDQGVQNDKVFIILQGHVSVFTDDEFILTLRRQGDLVGEMSVVTKLDTTARVVADNDVELFSISSEDIDQSGQAELKSTVYKLFLDILTQKLTLTTKQVIGYQATTEELSEKKEELAKSEDAIQQKEAILQQVLGSMSDGVVVMEKEGQLLHVNAAFIDMIGIKDIPKDLNLWPQKLGFFRPDEQTPYKPEQLPMATIFKGKPVDSEEIHIRNSHIPEGIWLQASSRMLTSENNPVHQGAVVVFRDFTKKKLEEIALISAKENAEATAKAKSEFLAVMSHELRTPLNGIMGMTDLIYSTELNPEQTGYLDILKISSENLLGLIRNILDYNALESSTQPLKTEVFSLKTCLDQIVSTYNIHAQKKGLSLKIIQSPDLPEKLNGHERGILQVLRNLTDNAIKFTEKGEILISVSLLSIKNKVAEIQITIKDTGIGIDKNRLEELFQPFSQADSSYSRSFDGAGIGLSLCKKYVDKMKGDIRITSEIGKGSQFDVVLNLSTAIESADGVGPEPAVTEPPPADTSFSQKYPLNILVAEDNVLNQKLIKKVLEKLGYTPEIACNGIEAVERNRSDSFDLILMDLQMPEMDGLEASRIINQEMDSSGKPKIIALTANVSEDVKESCIQAGMIDFATKPLKVNHLVTLLQKLE